MSFVPLKGIEIEIPKAVLNAVFDECDKYDDDETGGRILGTYGADPRSLRLAVQALIDSGPRARRSAVSFFQDGDYQEQVFREIEAKHPAIEHLGNWHTHHMNGLQHLSNGDLQTYHKIVNHPNHNTDFFYAMLVITKHRSKDPLGRYSVKHYLFRRADPRAYEISARAIRLVDKTQPNVVRSISAAASVPARTEAAPSPGLLADKQIVEEFFPEIHPFQSPKLGMFWKGLLPLADKHKQEVVVVPDTERKDQFSVPLRNAPASLASLNGRLEGQLFPSARAALINVERACNTELLRATNR